MSNFTLNIHRVSSVSIGPIKERRTEGGITSATRDILIETPEGSFEITLFSPNVNDDYEGKLLEIEI